ncbi:hypothetical protein GCM10025876_22320 [Demequina litorisediminis]|uniref:Uncharacterized protein n=1 Tax=Demequina litorisediminis TaxID=1849022 RepID=A0ABQ6IFW6_9MICO|nr:hypothetical protein GCM10025876_22320 [Demequina litorisediminis]
MGAGAGAGLDLDVTVTSGTLNDGATTTFTVDAGDQHVTYSVATGLAAETTDDVEYGYSGYGKARRSAVRRAAHELRHAKQRLH